MCSGDDQNLRDRNPISINQNRNISNLNRKLLK